MNKKGFTLFTALVSFVLILLTAMLVQTMIKAERDRTEVISNIEEQAEMQAMADLTRAEALQTFNYSIRKSIEDYFDSEMGFVNAIEIYPQRHSFEEIKNNFADRFFGAGSEVDAQGNIIDIRNQFVYEMANTLVNSFPRKKFIGSYEISIELKGADESEKRTVLIENLKLLLEHSIENIENREFFEVVACEDGNPEDCLGTFYLNLRTSDLPDEVYESLPQIKVKNYRTQRVLQESIFPRGNIKFYIPIRLFKAMAEARSLALEFGEETGSAWKSNYGLFSPRIHNEIEEMKLGMCDPGYCNVRSNPYVPPEQKNMDDFTCPNYPGFSYDITVDCDQDMYERRLCSNPGDVVLKYNPNTITVSESQGNALGKLVRNRLCYIAYKNIGTGEFLDQNPGDKLELVGNNLGRTQCPSVAESDSRISMNIITKTRNSVETIPKAGKVTDVDSVSPPRYNANAQYGIPEEFCPMSRNASSPLGLLDWGTYGIGIDESTNKIIEKTKGIPNAVGCTGFPVNLSTANYATCSEISKIVVNLSFMETEEKYIVDKFRQPVYVVKIIDNYFTPENNNIAFHQNERFASDSRTCGLTGNGVSTPSNVCNAESWTCESYGPQGAAPEIGGGHDGGCQIAT